jgi:hypothetical protein
MSIPILNNTVITGNLTVTGNLTAFGDFSVLDTIVTTTSALSVTNTGTGPALSVNQTGAQPVADFKDDGAIALRIADGGNVGINNTAPTERLTVNGNVLATGALSGAKAELLPAAANGMLIRTTSTAAAQDACHIVVRPIGGVANVATAINLRASGGSGEIYDGYICSSNGTINIGGSNVSPIFRVSNGSSGPNTGSSQFSVNTTATVNVDIANSNAAAAVLRVTGSTSQTGNLTEWRNVTPTTLAFITPAGAFSTVSTISSQSTGFFNHIAASTKSFLIDHPLHKGKRLQYGSLESPYHGVRLTGKASIKDKVSEVTIELPNYISVLVHAEDHNIQLTNINHDKVLFVKNVDISNNIFTVSVKRSWLDKQEYEFYWSFTAIRKDIPQLQVEC